MRRYQRTLLIAIGIISAALAAGAYAVGALHRLELTALDARFSVRGARTPPRDMVLVSIDQKTQSELHARFPFPRRYHARAIDAIHRDGPRAIAYDVTFTQPTDVSDDNALIRAVARARPVVLAATEVDNHGRTNVLGGGSLLDEIGARPGSVSFPLDPGTVFRRVPYAIDRLKHFAVVTVEAAEHHSIAPGGLGGRSAWVDYLGPPGTVPTVSFVDVVRHRVPRGFFHGKIVVVGTSIPSLQDFHPTSTTGDTLMSGSEILANAIDTLRRGAPLRDVPGAVNLVAILLLSLLAPLLGLRVGPLRAIWLALTAGVLWLVFVQIAFDHGRIVAVTYPIAGLLFASIGGLGVHYIGASVERERTRDLFARFVPEPVVGELLARANGELRLGGERRESTVLFADLRGFTSWSERRSPDEVIEVLNRYLGEMSDAILDHGGTLVAYMGDGIMAVFGAPLEQRDHADRALAAAREMLAVRLARFNAGLRADGLGGPFRMGIGLNSGTVLSGNVGSPRRVEYTAVGDTTNTAARLEAMTKSTPHQLLIADTTRRLLRHRPEGLVLVDELEVRGREGRVPAWTLA
jgi:adenylate cyclase